MVLTKSQLHLCYKLNNVNFALYSCQLPSYCIQLFSEQSLVDLFWSYVLVWFYHWPQGQIPILFSNGLTFEWRIIGGKNAGSPAMTQKPNSSFCFKILLFSKLRVMCQVKGWDQDHSLLFFQLSRCCAPPICPSVRLSKLTSCITSCGLWWGIFSRKHLTCCICHHFLIIPTTSA